MKMVYSNESHFLVGNMQNLIEAQSINTFIKNEFAQGAIGEVSAFDAWPEIWVIADEDYEQAIAIVNASQSVKQSEDWECPQCLEKNGAAFEVCWHCQFER